MQYRRSFASYMSEKINILSNRQARFKLEVYMRGPADDRR